MKKNILQDFQIFFSESECNWTQTHNHLVQFG